MKFKVINKQNLYFYLSLIPISFIVTFIFWDRSDNPHPKLENATVSFGNVMFITMIIMMFIFVLFMFWNELNKEIVVNEKHIHFLKHDYKIIEPINLLEINYVENNNIYYIFRMNNDTIKELDITFCSKKEMINILILLKEQKKLSYELNII